MNFHLSELEKQIADAVYKAATHLNDRAFFIGGFVRDRILGRPTNDIDIVCEHSGIQLARKTAQILNATKDVVVFKRFGTAMLMYKDLQLEFVGARKESYRSDSRKPDVEPGTLEDDQNRRDFTINAMAVALNGEMNLEVIDPFDGQADIEKRTIKTPLEPGKTFSDDPLRMMRAIRFATQLGYDIDPVTFKGIQENKERIHIVSAERITVELNKIILSPEPSIGFSLLSECGLLPIIFPELENLKGVEIRNGIGHKDNFYHTIEVLDNISIMTENLWLRWAAILHDIAKPDTKRFDNRVGWTFHGHEVVGTKIAYRVFKRFRLPLDHKMKYVQKMIRLHLRPISLTKDGISDSAVRRLLFDAGEDIDDLMTLCKADITSKNRVKVARIRENYEEVKLKLKAVEESDKIRNWQPPISGELIMESFNIKPSRAVGEIKDNIREAILDGKISNDYDAAYAYMITLGKNLGLELAIKN